MQLSRGGHPKSYQDDRMASHAVAGPPSGMLLQSGMVCPSLFLPTQRVGSSGFQQQGIKSHTSEEGMNTRQQLLTPQGRMFVPPKILSE